MISEEKDERINAMREQFDKVEANKTWELFEKPLDKEVFDVKRILSQKAENVYKARIVVKGYQQGE